ncbi:Molybdopterin or thiamine biosynthesis adenylyltransferase [Streptosporangium subroseum]|uniref:Molybdopterin or thiamine biosynthesis adenylyltransferase n=1 Tax=Streptosporangium subroseum TaxID=106412 RepID=A0A239NIY5_9ACTN|nr:ThiF family adenylyltransferase [Streptosporangium subroseum]SNT54835.1 Molybdopterin or thiamine biosynthesis adenylyltransferase [Streptosporangium subroseum]
MRPRLKPALRRITRDERTLQFGLHPRHAVVLTDLEPEVRRWVESLDGVRDLAEVLVGAADAGIGEDRGRTLLDLLVSRGVVDDAGVGPGPLRTLTMAERDRLQPDLDGLSLSPGTTDGGLATLERRRDAQVRVYGAGRVGAQIVALLAASGVGRICVVDPGTARNRDVVPGGLGWTEVGMSRQDGAVAVARSLAPGLTAWTGDGAAQLADGARRPDLAVLAPVVPLDGLLIRELLAWEIPHLLVTAYEGFGSVGPLVLPGRSTCLQCLDLTRRDRDPGWPIVSARLGGFPAGEIACGTVLSTLVAAAAAGHALALIDGREVSVTNGTMDVMPDWRWKRRSWSVHPQCRCFRNELGSLTMVASAPCR